MFKNKLGLKKNSKTSSLVSGMTYVELIVVLSIFSVISAVTLFNYKQFQLKVEIKNLANDITLKIVEAQRSATSGKLAPVSQQPSNPSAWKPSYGMYFNSQTPTVFYSFIDLDQNKNFVPPIAQSCPVGECLAGNPIYITKGNHISSIKVLYLGGPSSCPPPSNPPCPTIIVDDLVVTFTRPDSGATFLSQSAMLTNVHRLEIAVSSPLLEITAFIHIYPSGRVELI